MYTFFGDFHFLQGGHILKYFKHVISVIIYKFAKS